MRRKKEDYVVIAFALILLGIVFAIAFMAIQTSTPSGPAPTPTLNPVPTIFKDSPPAQPLTDTLAQQRLLDKVENRPKLSSDDSFAKAKILAKLPVEKKSGILYESNSIHIEYVNSADLFMVEIISSNISQAKAEANVWFRTNGVSQKGICDYPVMFYLSWDTMNKFRGTNLQFSPVGNGC
jgi:hypothetical protein